MRQIAEVVLFCLAYVTIPFLPRFMVVGLARWSGALAFACTRRDRRVALANLEVAYGGTLSAEERLALARQAFQSIALVLLDILWFSWFSRRRTDRYVGFAPSFDVYFATNPLVVVTGHLGNWETMGLGVALRGAPTLSVAMPLTNMFVDSMLNRMRRSTGQTVVEREGAVRTLLRELRGGGRVALLLDQNTLPEEGGVFVETFGLPAPMSKAASALARKTGAPIVCLWCLPDSRGFYTAHASELLRAGPGQTDEDVTRKVSAVFELAIRQNPGNWLWMYKRWKYRPRGVPAEKYPFYAKEYDGNARQKAVTEGEMESI